MVNTNLHPFTKALGVLCYVTSILYLVEHFYHHHLFVLTYSILGAFLLVCAFFFLSMVSRLIVALLLIAGTICFYVEQIEIGEVISGFGENINLLSLFLLIPIIGTFMSSAGYLSALKKAVQEREQRSGQHPYRLSFLLTATIGIILNFGSMAIVKRIAEESFSSYRDQKLTLTIMRAFAFCMLWSPYFVNVGLILVLFDLSWIEIGGYGLLLAALYLLVCVFMFSRISFPDDPLIERQPVKRTAASTPSLTPFFFFCGTLVGLSFFLEFLWHVNMIIIVCLLSIVLPLIWSLATKTLQTFTQDLSVQVQHSFFQLKNEIAIFISAGFFGKAMASTEIGAYISSWLFQASFGSVYILSYLLVLLTIFLAQIGIHPVIIVIGIGSALSPENFGVSAHYLALLLLVAWSMATQLSPFSGQMLMAAKLMNQPAKTIMRQNVAYVAVLTVVLVTAVYSLYLLHFI
ncbi:hypothetical protein M3202_07395 [Alkalihalobacillus oceani]|uniref:Uncharacterized protein n=1 Tax=Halalkalibacter oceani TaxID=1653776 RepID=A0A9X2DN34_9BACI|nr:hypothetical protein [Halalkalibacter oceani]MCM3713906.1 hypothetical protein [Halalkalibacter oceani]